MTTLPEKIRVMRAAHSGFPVEYLQPNDNTWQPSSNPTWNWLDNNYRIAKYVVPNVHNIDECTAEIEKLAPLLVPVALRLVDLPADIRDSYVNGARTLNDLYQSYKYTGN